MTNYFSSGFSSNYADQMTDRLTAEFYEKRYFGGVSVLENIRTGNYNNYPAAMPEQKDVYVPNNTDSNQAEKNGKKGKVKDFFKRNWKNLLCGAAIIASIVALLTKGKVKLSGVDKAAGAAGKKVSSKAGVFIDKLKAIPSKIAAVFKKKPATEAPVAEVVDTAREAVKTVKPVIPSLPAPKAAAAAEKQVSKARRILSLPEWKAPLALPPARTNVADSAVDNLGKTFTLANGNGTVVLPTVQQKAAEKAAEAVSKEAKKAAYKAVYKAPEQLLLEAPKQAAKPTIGQKASKLVKDVFNVFFGIFKKK